MFVQKIPFFTPPLFSYAWDQISNSLIVVENLFVVGTV